MTFEARFLVALAVTVGLETAVLAVAVRLTRAPEQRAFPRVVAAGILASTLTLPYLWFILPRFVNGPWFVVLGESLVVLVEAAVLALVLPASTRRALALSLICNVTSWLAGPPLVTAILR
jgi:hypothetical protein